jgi:DNA repair exonuclease SbcCD ATPase subunit
MLGPLVMAVQFASDDEYDVTLSELAEWLMGQKIDWVLTSTHSANALDWVRYTHDKRASRRRSSTNDENESGRTSSRTRKRQHSNDEVILPRLPRPDPQSREKKRWAGTRSSTGNNVAEAEAQSESEPEPEHEPELDHGMEMDVDDSNPNGTNGNAGENTNTKTNLSGTDNETLDVSYPIPFPREQLTIIQEAITASARRLELARHNLKEYEDDLETEREALKAIVASLAEASEAHEAAIQKWRDAVVKADTKQNELRQFQDLAQSFSHDTQAALEQHSQSLRRLRDQAIEAEKHAENELRTRRREYCLLEEKKDAKEGTIKKISARIRRYQDDIDAEEVKHQRLLAEHYLELLSNDIIQDISIADISYARILEIKLERDQRIWYKQR